MTNYLYNLPKELLYYIFELSYIENKQICLEQLVTKVNSTSIWAKPSNKLFKLVNKDSYCLQHPYHDLDRYRNKKHCWELKRPNSTIIQCRCESCKEIEVMDPWHHEASELTYKCAWCVYYGFPCFNCKMYIFNCNIQEYLFNANFKD